MLNITKEQKDNSLVIRLSGAIEESVNFDQLIGPPPPSLVVICKEVPRINSVGVKAWIKYFQTLQSKGSKVKFVECSTAIVEQINLMSNFICGGVVESVYVPFACEKCQNEFIGLFKTDDLKKIQMNVPEFKCPKCAGKAVFDDIPEEYFGFLSR